MIFMKSLALWVNVTFNHYKLIFFVVSLKTLFDHYDPSHTGHVTLTYDQLAYATFTSNN